jgi:deoxyribonucleoside regulator
MGGVGDVCLHFIDVDGNVVDKGFDKRVVGITAEKLKQVPVRICVSYGSHKVLPSSARHGEVT